MILVVPTKIKKDDEPQSEFQKLLAEEGYLNIPKPGDVIKGTVIEIESNCVTIDIPSYRIGVVRGPELVNMGLDQDKLAVGDEVEATVIDLENENGNVELSFRYAGAMRAWEKLRALMQEGTVIPVKITEANRGGLTTRVHGVTGFMPVSQLAPENYPRVSGGDKTKILEALRAFAGTTMQVKVIDVYEPEEKLIVSEKVVWEEEQRGVLSSYAVGDVIEGTVTAIADFGAFVKFVPKESAENATAIEGLVHISEIAWQRIDHPKDILKIGDTVKAKIIGIEGSKIFLSMKALVDDPWKSVVEKYKIGQLVKGKILKENPFGFFVELDPEIHGLAHISELANRPVRNLHEIAKPGDTLEWRVVSIEPEQHRLGLSLKTEEDEKKDEEKEDEPAPSESVEKKEASSEKPEAKEKDATEESETEEPETKEE